MKLQLRQFTVCAALILALAPAAFAQSPPANDYFVNRIALTGSSLTFTGTLDGATYEPGESSVPGDVLSTAGHLPANWP